jgi:TRAP-type C4-dicarboxylate transport system substrate-binding protein
MFANKRLLVAALVATAIAPLAAAVNVKLATLVPPGTSWHKALLEMGNTWNKDTQGRVTLSVLAAGNQDETTILTKMRPGFETLQGAFLTAGGLAELDDAFNVFSIPFFIESEAELTAIQKKLQPMLEQRLQAKGFKFLAWGSGGWVQLFSKKPLRTLADVKAAKLYTSKGSDKWVQWYVANGFHPVALVPANIPEQLKLSTGLIDTAPTPPYLALTQGLHRDAKYMLEVRVAPLTGALLMSNSAWKKISPEDQAKVQAAAQTLEQRVTTEAPAQDAEAVRVMTGAGLQVITPDAKAAAEFRAAATQLMQTMRGSMIPADVFDAAVQERDAFRKSKGK